MKSVLRLQTLLNFGESPQFLAYSLCRQLWNTLMRRLILHHELGTETAKNLYEKVALCMKSQVKCVCSCVCTSTPRPSVDTSKNSRKKAIFGFLHAIEEFLVYLYTIHNTRYRRILLFLEEFFCSVRFSAGGSSLW